MAGSFPYFLFLFILFSLGACSGKQAARPLFTLEDSTGIDFQNTVVDSKGENSFYFRNFYNGGGVALGDINNDGLADVLLTSNMGENKLYLNKGNFRFEDISTSAGLRQDSMWSTGAVMVDINADGFLDIYVCNSGYLKKRKNKLYINNQDRSFTEKAADYGLDISGYCTQASFFDYDMDGDLDCFLINNSPIPFSSLNYAGMRDVEISKWNVSEDLKGGGNHLYRNDDNRFTEVTREAGLHSGLISFGLGVSVGDINGDHYPDIYVGNDFIEKDYLYINQGNGTFRDELEERIRKISMSSMSSDLGDINNDGHPEIFTTDMIPEDDYRLKTTGTYDNIDLYLSKQKAGLYHQYVKNCLQLNNGDGSFSEIADFSGVSATDWSWGAVFFDGDNDGLNDLFICNGINRDVGDLDFLDFFSNDVYREMVETGRKKEMDEILKRIPVNPLPNRVFRNAGGLKFTDAGDSWGFEKPSFSNSLAYADLDNDGDLDLVINNENMPAFVYRNHSRQQNQNSFLSLSLRSSAPNTFAVGSKICLYSGGQVFYREVVPSRGFQSAMDHRQVIGLGKITSIDSMVIIWPDRRMSSYRNVRVNQHLELEQPVHSLPAPVNDPSGSTLLVPFQVSLQKHVEDDHIDFYYERNLPQMLSRQGPQAAVADVNGDGKDDLYIAGAAQQPGRLYLQDEKGLINNEQEIFNRYADFEDIALVFFDADKDSDTDLYIGSGGNRFRGNTRELQHRLYRNDGKGNFTLDIQAFPPNEMNISVAAAHDFDGDGDQDLFVGSGSVPFQYGVSPVSYLFRNDGKGHFKDVTREMNPALVAPGMITSAIWADLDGDHLKELVIAGTWMPVRVFSYRNGKMEEWKNTGLQELHGWWQSLKAVDVNQDGRMDLVAGNVGDNFYLRPSSEQPAKLWVADLDGDGKKDQFLTRRVKDADVPVFLKREITDQFPALKKENLKHSDYARKTVQDLFPPDVLKKADVRLFNYCSSVVAINSGDGRFVVQPLPYSVQLSSINAIEATDLDADGDTDLVMAGNMFGFPPQFGRLDAGYGSVLLNDGKGNFSVFPSWSSGLRLKGETRDIRSMQLKNKNVLLFLQNDDLPVVMEVRKGS